MILYQDVSTSQILEPSQRGLISSSTKLAGKIGQFEICTLCPYVLNLKFSLIRNSSSRDLYTMNLVLPYYSTSFLFCPLLLVMVKLWSFTTGLRIRHCEIWSTLIWAYFRFEQQARKIQGLHYEKKFIKTFQYPNILNKFTIFQFEEYFRNYQKNNFRLFLLEISKYL